MVCVCIWESKFYRIFPIVRRNNGHLQTGNGIYYLFKTINRKPYRVSLETKNYHQARELYNIWHRAYLTAKLNKQPIIPVPLNKQIKIPNAVIDTGRPSLQRAFGQYLKVSEHNINSSAHLKQKKKLGQFLKNNTIDWQHITQDGMIELQEKLTHSLSLSYACKMITHLKAFLNFCVKKDYFSLDDLKKIDFMKTPKPKKRKSVISDSDISKILEFCRNKGNLDFMYYL